MGSALPVCMKVHSNECNDTIKACDHCCKHNCFTDKKSQRPQLLKSLLLYHADYLTDVIMNYLPANNTTLTGKGYFVHSHASNTLCRIWSQYFIHPSKPIKIIICGDKNVGKTTLVNTFTGKNTMINTFTKYKHNTQSITVNNRTCQLDIDYIFPNKDSTVYDEIIRSGHIFICCFAINSKESYKNALKDVQRIKQYKNKVRYMNWSIMLAATKCDLTDETLDSNNIKEKINSNKEPFVDSIKVIGEANKLNVAYVETSAKLGINIDMLFRKSILEYWTQSVCRTPEEGNLTPVTVTVPNMSLFVDRQGRRI